MPRMPRVPRVPRLRSLLLMLAATAATTATAAASGCHRQAVYGEEDYAVLTVDNRSSENLTVYMNTDGGQHFRIGDAPALHYERFTLQERRIREIGLVQFVAVRTAGDIAAASDRVRIQVGDSLGIIVTR